MGVVKIPHWSHSAGGRPIELVQSGDQPFHPILLIGGVHGDEPEGVELVARTLDWLLADANAESTVKVPWILIPCLNPDGYAEKKRTNGNGVDLNRNYPTRDWNPEAAGERYYPGKSAGSEPEIKALVNLIETVRPRLIIHCHSWNPLVLCTGETGMKDAERLAESSGYEIKTYIGYETPGSLSKFGWAENNIPVICIEEQEGAELNTVWPRFADGMKAIFLDDGMRRS